jgi:hypothetical protein
MPWAFPSPRARLRKADDLPADDPLPDDAADLRRQVLAAVPALVALLLETLRTLGTATDAAALRTALLAGDLAAATAVLAAPAATAVLGDLGPPLLTLMQATSAASAPSLQAALSALLTTQEALLAPTTQAALPTIVATVATWGLSVAQAARLAQAMVGLTARQVQTLTRYRRLLEAIETDPARALNLVERRSAALRRQRAERIAQTVSMQAVILAQRLAVEQAIGRGTRDGTRLRRFWELGDHPCARCEPIPGLNPDGRALHEAFVTPDGSLHEPLVHPRCMCSLRYEEV